MMRVVAQMHQQVEGHAAARAELHLRHEGGLPRPVEPDEDIGSKPRLLRAEKLAQAGRALFLAGLDQHLRVEAEPPAFRDHRAQRLDRDEMLALVVHRAAAVPLLAAHRDLPGIEPLAPFRREAAHHVAMAIDQHGRQRGILDARRDEDWPAALARIVEHRRLEPHALNQRRHRLRAVARQGGQAVGQLALGRHGDELAQPGEIGPVIEAALRACDRPVPRSAHALVPAGAGAMLAGNARRG
jgi:hypothetical protein